MSSNGFIITSLRRISSQRRAPTWRLPFFDASRQHRSFVLCNTRLHQTRLHSSLSSPTPDVDIDTNPTLDWKGATHSTSSYVRHVLINANGTNTMEAITQSLHADQQSSAASPTKQPPPKMMNATHLLELGSIWYLPVSSPRDPSLGKKPIRLTLGDKNKNDNNNIPETLNKGDYLRIHFKPRRYLEVYKHDWSLKTSPLIVGQGDGWLVLNKPPNVPVHATVDNCRENVAACLLRANPHALEYVTAAQRLDHNTSGLFVVATSPHFCAYFHQLLRYKTAQVLLDDTDTRTNKSTQSAIQKRYRCLVYNNNISDTSSMGLQPDQILRHYLEPSERAPKRFVATPPADGDDWPECQLRILSVTPIDNDKDNNDAPTTVSELQVELLTGRTHQIRGQLAAEGYPIVGDTMYGGGSTTNNTSSREEVLALQCQSLEFVDPDWHQNDDESWSWRLSRRWNRFALDDAPWTRQHQQSVGARVPHVSLSPGRNKYVLIWAINSEDEDEWFVKSASREECGGAHHGHVAQELREWLLAAGYENPIVLGGGWVLMDPVCRTVLIYGKSHGYGRANHAVTAELVRTEYVDYDVSFDDGLLD